MDVKASTVDDIRGALARMCSPEMVRIVRMRAYTGPNPLSDRPLVLCTIEVSPSLDVTDLFPRLQKRFPELKPTFAADHPAEAFADAVRGLTAGLLTLWVRMSFGSGMLRRRGDRISFWIDHPVAVPLLQALMTALLVVAAEAVGETDRAKTWRHLKYLAKVCADRRPNQVSVLMMDAARRRNIPFLQVTDGTGMWQFGWGARSLLFQDASSNLDGALTRQFGKNKHTSKTLFRNLSLPTPDWRMVGPGEDPRAAAEKIGFPCVVKPYNQGQGRGVVANISDMEELQRAVAAARAFSEYVMVEKHSPGDDHRLMVAGGKLIAAVRRVPPSLTGDGRKPVRELIADLNAERAGALKAANLKPVPLDDTVDQTLQAQGLNLDSVAEKGRKVLLRSNANYSTGGTVESVLDRVHPEIRAMAERLSAAFGFRTTGIDYISTDISRSYKEVGGALIEVNDVPGIKNFGAAGLDVDEIASIVLGDFPGRIPVTLLIAPDEFQDDLFNALAKASSGDPGRAVVRGDRAQIGACPLPEVGLKPNQMVEAMLRYKDVTSVIILWSPALLQDLGLPVDEVDRTIIVGGPPRREWLSLLERRSKSVVGADNGAQALPLAMQGAPAEQLQA